MQVQQLASLELDTLASQTNPDGSVECGVPPEGVCIVKHEQRAIHLALPPAEVALLPRPPGPVDVAVVQVEDGVPRGGVRVRHGAVQPAGRPVARRVEGLRVGDPLKRAVVADLHGRVHLRPAAEPGQRPRRKVAPDAPLRLDLGVVERAELRLEAGKGPVLEAAAAAAVGEVEGGTANLFFFVVSKVSILSRLRVDLRFCRKQKRKKRKKAYVTRELRVAQVARDKGSIAAKP